MTRRFLQIMGSRGTWVALIAMYCFVLAIVLSPVLVASVGADDSYWVMHSAPRADGSLWLAFWEPLSRALDFNGQARTTALATSERQVLAVIGMNVATTLAVSPAVVWGVTKAFLLLCGWAAAVILLRQLRYRDGRGEIRALQPTTIAFVAISLPLVIAFGAKAQNIANLNGWIHYPTLAYGPFVVYLGVSSLALVALALLQRNFRVWVTPVVLVMMAIALYVNLSYELIALTIPVASLVVALQPAPKVSGFLNQWRAKLTVLLSLGGTYSGIFLWIRWRISRMECHATDSCYPGTVVELNAVTLWNNFAGAFPGRTGQFVVDRALASGRDIPTVNSLSVSVAIIGALVVMALLASWKTRHSARALIGTNGSANRDSGADARGLLHVIAIALLISVGSAAITGITANAVAQLQSSMLSYRSGVVIWSGVALAAVAGVRMLMLSSWRAVRVTALATMMAVLVVGISLYLPRNIESAQTARSGAQTHSIDVLHEEIALGDRSRAGDKRRCDSVAAHRATYKQNLARFDRTISAAYQAFDYYYDLPYCSTSEGLAVGDITR